MKKNIPIIPLIVSVALGVGTLFVSYSYLNQVKNKQKIELEKKLKIEMLPKYKIVVSKRDIKAYSELKVEDFEVITLEGKNQPKNVLVDPKALEGKYAALDILNGDIIQRSSVAEAGKPQTIQDIVPVGKRAVSVKISDTVLDFVKPGDKVDLLADFADNNGQPYSKLILQNVMVLAKGNQIGPEHGILPGQGTPKDANMLTFALDVKQAEALSSLATRKIRVVWRSNQDSKIAETAGTSAEYLLAKSTPVGDDIIQRGVFIY